MLLPTWRAVAVMVAGVPVAAVAGLVQPELWLMGPAWIGAACLLLLADAALTPRIMGLPWIEAPVPSLEIGGQGTMAFLADGTPPGLETQLEADDLLSVTSAGPGRFTLTARRRGTAAIRALHVRVPGPLKLMRRVSTITMTASVPVTLAISRVREAALQMLSQERAGGAVLQPDRAESMEFHALRDHRPGDDPRQVNWRQSARHGALLVRETRAERNRTLMLAIDCGRLMGEPLDGGLPRLDHALQAALVLAYAGLRAGDRVGLFAFADRPVLVGGTVRNTSAFPALQRMAAGVGYYTEETNHTLGLTTLAGTLHSRALVIVMTDFADPTGAALMVENVGRLLERHLVLFVAFQDDALLALAEAPPVNAGAVSRAVVAGALLAERERVLVQLRRMGVEVLQAPARALGPALIARYAMFKRQDRL